MIVPSLDYVVRKCSSDEARVRVSLLRASEGSRIERRSSDKLHQSTMTQLLTETERNLPMTPSRTPS
jgi:hypothetical protein